MSDTTTLVRPQSDGSAKQNPLRAGLDTNRITDPCNIVFFGASGDLAKRMLFPAMYNLRLGDVLPANFGIVGFSRSPETDDSFRQRRPRGDRRILALGSGEGPALERLRQASVVRHRRLRRPGVVQAAQAAARRERRATGDRAQPALLPLDAAAGLHEDRRTAGRCRPRTARQPPGLDADHRREAVRHGPRLGARAAGRDHEGLRRAPDLPHRPLPR